MKTNKKTKVPAVYTAEGAVASKINPELELRRSVLTCMLFENSFYENGESIADRIKNLVPKVKAEKVAQIAIEARTKQKLRHVPLLLAREMARTDSHKHLVASTVENVIQRADELGELIAIYWKDKKQPLSAQIKKGLGNAFKKFDEFSLGRYQNSGNIKLRDVLFLTHPKPNNKKQEKLWKKLVDKQLSCPEDTWEVQLSASKGENKKEVWTNLLKEGKLGALALLRNLRNCQDAGVEDSVIRKALKNCNPEKALPFRFITAARYAPKFEPELEELMFKCLQNQEKLAGKTVLIVDVSGSMGGKVSGKSEVSRLDTACALAMLVRELSDNVSIYATAGNDYSREAKTQLVPARNGFALRDAIHDLAGKLGGGGIFLKQVMDFTCGKEKKADRVIVISDSQDCDLVNKPDSAQAYGNNNYLMDISCEKYGIGYNKFTVINGFSESLIDYVIQSEKFSNQ